VRTTRGEAYNVRVSLESTCPHVWMIAGDLDEVDALQQIGLRGGRPSVLQAAYAHCIHAACPVPSGLIKSTVEPDWHCLGTFPCASARR
jgi:hypothetical protein